MTALNIQVTLPHTNAWTLQDILHYFICRHKVLEMNLAAILVKHNEKGVIEVSL